MGKIFKKIMSATFALLMVISTLQLGSISGIDLFGFNVDATSCKVGSLIKIGSYPKTQVKDVSLKAELGEYATEDGFFTFSENGKKYYRYSTSATTYFYEVEPLYWIVLSTGYDGIYLLCKDVLEQHIYDDSEYSTWESSSLRSWLNDYFYNNAFTDSEKSEIKSSKLLNDGKKTGPDTTDKIFVPSLDDLSLVSNDKMISSATEFAKARGVNYSGDGAFWWLRTRYDNDYTTVQYAYNVDYSGSVRTSIAQYDVCNLSYSFVGVRPALKLYLNSSVAESTDIIGSISDCGLTQTHICDNYSETNDIYEISNNLVRNLQFTAMDGTDSTVDFCIPGLAQYYIPQGLAYYKAKNWLLISSYDKTKERPSVITALNFSTGKFVAQFNLYTASGSPSKSHAGGIAVSDYNLYITDGSGVAYFPLSELDIPGGYVKNVKYKDTTTFAEMGSTNTAYVNISSENNVLWAGNFFCGDGVTSKAAASLNYIDENWMTRAPDSGSVILGFRLDSTGYDIDASANEWDNLVNMTRSTYHITVPDSINDIQGATVYNGNLYLSRTILASFSAAISACKIKLSNGNQQNINLSNKFSTVNNLSGAENIIIVGGKMYTVYESGALNFYESDYEGKEVSAWTNVLKQYTDVIWRTDYTQISTRQNIFNCPIDVEVYDKDNELVCSIVNNIIDEKISAKDSTVVAEVCGDTKIIWTPANEDYTFVIKGNDMGNMDYTVITYDKNLNETEKANFFDIDINTDTVLTGNLKAESSSFGLENYKLVGNDNQSIESSSVDDEAEEAVALTVTSTEGGIVKKPNTVTLGDTVELYATPTDNNYYFAGWYENDKLISSETTYTFVAKSERNLVAKFEQHKFEVTSEIKSTCTEDGETIYKCGCGETKTVIVTAKGHTDTDRNGYCDNCGIMTDANLANPCRNTKIHIASSRSVDYKSDVTITATADNVPEGYHLELIYDGMFGAKGTNKEVTYYAGKITGNAKYIVQVVDAKGYVQQDANGNDLTETGTITCNANFFAKIVAFFKGLFGSLPNVAIKP